MSIEHLLRGGSVAAWIICIACLLPAVLRLVRFRGRYLDGLWGTVFLLAVNRLAFLTHISAEASLATAIVLALTMAYLSTWYQRHDA
ncbi:hypothetical protein [Sphingomonas nostoxanthinifaciens]|uniref:hypothetical protein n=1 Tax=Sphingomonas nostoxanthinifaciens TaxID=2872652 RepID=UPI001CC1ED40|nr:hypothetical protein [Sphingomonas nostoxanthinifaciens]UAK25876.1 hypothetical protein K8P63_07075 [Sphingomonas nostoxanthinifaciens]